MTRTRLGWSAAFVLALLLPFFFSSYRVSQFTLVLAYAVVEAGSSWLLLGAVRAIGPHDLVTWWMNVDDLLGFGVDVVLEPLRICLIAAAYDLCLRRLEERRTAAGEPSAAARESEDPRPVTA